MAVHAVKEEEKGLGLGGLLNVCIVEVESVVCESGMGGVLFAIKDGLLPFDLFVLKDLFAVLGAVVDGDGL